MRSTRTRGSPLAAASANAKVASPHGGGETRAAPRAAGHAQTIKPIPLRPAGPGGFTRDDFAVDPRDKMVICPAGRTVAITPGGRAVFDWRCRPCPLRERCTPRQGRQDPHLHPHEAEPAARQPAADPPFQASYRRWRPMVERLIAWLVAKGHRRVRYRDLARNQLEVSLRVAASNLRRLVTVGLDTAVPGGCWPEPGW